MPKEFGRNRRVSDLIQRDLATLIQREMDAKRFGLITVSLVNVSPDLLNAKVYVTSLNDDVDRKALLVALNERAGHFRHELAQKSTLRTTPKLNFVFDSSIEHGTRLSALIDSVQVKSDDDANEL
ncbi:MAG: 30S ribosome-binding factor RbfA [Gammaproteobacteria bacterium]|jgi:ribosome-binding factor A|nr:30S ribosome-binding factor RbfA [Gammaproteobacteria bacterium]